MIFKPANIPAWPWSDRVRLNVELTLKAPLYANVDIINGTLRIRKIFDYDRVVDRLVNFKVDVDNLPDEVDIPIPLQYIASGRPLTFKVELEDHKDGCGITRVLERHCDFVKVTSGVIDLTIAGKVVSIKPNKELEELILSDKPRAGYFTITLPERTV